MGFLKSKESENQGDKNNKGSNGGDEINQVVFITVGVIIKRYAQREKNGYEAESHCSDENFLVLFKTFGRIFLEGHGIKF